MPEIACYNPLEILLPYQRDWLVTGQTSMFMIGLMARQTGKSLMCMAEAVHDCAENPKTTWIALSTTERQSKELLLKGRQWAEAFFVSAPEKLKSWLEYTYSATEIKFGNGSRIISVPATENSRGFSGNIILDEYALHSDGGFKVWRAAYGIVTNRLSGRKKLRIISTPSSKTTKFYDLWTKDNIFTKKMITLPEAISQGLPADEEEIKAGLDDASMYEIEFLCQFADSYATAFPIELLVRQSKSCPVGLTSGERYIGFDVGRTNDLSVITTLIRRGSELYTENITILRKTPYAEQLKVLGQKLKGVSKCYIDSTGIGSMLAEEARRIYGAKVEGYTFTQPSKSALMNGLHKALDTGSLWIPDDRDLRDDINSMNKMVSSNGTISYTSRGAKDGHSDRTCSLALAVAASTKNSSGVMPVSFPMHSMM